MSARGEQKYLEDKQDRTLDDVLRLIELRLLGDNPADDARLVIAYREQTGMFRRVLLDGLTGKELREVWAAAKERYR